MDDSFSQEWFSAEFARHFTLLAFLSFLSLLGRYGLQGRHRGWVMAAWVAALALGCVGLVAAALAWLLGQPAHVVKPLAISGFVLTVVFAGLYRTLQQAYREAELRKMTAQDI